MYVSGTIIYIFLNFCFSCTWIQPSLTREQQIFVNQIEKDYQAHVKVEHDYEAIKMDKNNGTIYIIITNSKIIDISNDTIGLEKNAYEVYKNFIPVLNYKDKYKNVVVKFLEMEKKSTKDTQIEKIITEKAFKFEIEGQQ